MTLISENNIKNINISNDINNIPIEERGSDSISLIKTNNRYLRASDLVNNLTTDDSTKVLTASQGKVIGDFIGELPEFEKDGDGTKYLSDDGSYKEISIQNRIQNDGNTQFVDTQANEVAIDLSPSLSGDGGSETGRFKLARNFFELYAEKIYANPNFKHKYQIITKDNGGIDIIVTDTDFSLLGEPSRDNTYSFDYDGLSNPNQVARMKELQDAVDTIADLLGVL